MRPVYISKTLTFSNDCSGPSLYQSTQSSLLRTYARHQVRSIPLSFAIILGDGRSRPAANIQYRPIVSTAFPLFATNLPASTEAPASAQQKYNLDGRLPGCTLHSTCIKALVLAGCIGLNSACTTYRPTQVPASRRGGRGITYSYKE